MWLPELTGFSSRRGLKFGTAMRVIQNGSSWLTRLARLSFLRSRAASGEGSVGVRRVVGGFSRPHLWLVDQRPDHHRGDRRRRPRDSPMAAPTAARAARTPTASSRGLLGSMDRVAPSSRTVLVDHETRTLAPLHEDLPDGVGVGDIRVERRVLNHQPPAYRPQLRVTNRVRNPAYRTRLRHDRFEESARKTEAGSATTISKFGVGCRGQRGRRRIASFAPSM